VKQLITPIQKPNGVSFLFTGLKRKGCQPLETTNEYEKELRRLATLAEKPNEVPV